MKKERRSDRRKKRQGLEVLAVPVVEAGEAVGLGRSASYAAARRGDIPTVKIGSRLLVPVDIFREQLRAKAKAKNTP